MNDDNGTKLDHREGWRRLSNVLKYAFVTVKPGEEVPPVPQELADWVNSTTNGVLAGIILGSLKQIWIHRQIGPVVAPDGLPSPAHKAKYLADENTKRLTRTLAGSIKAGLQLGGVFALFCGVENMCLVYRNTTDMWNSTIAAVVTGGTAGAAFPGGSVASRLRGAALGATAAGMLSFPSYWLLDQAAQRIPEEYTTRYKKAQMAANRFNYEGPLRRYPTAPDGTAQKVVEQLMSTIPTTYHVGDASPQESPVEAEDNEHETGQHKNSTTPPWWKFWQRWRGTTEEQSNSSVAGMSASDEGEPTQQVDTTPQPPVELHSHKSGTIQRTNESTDSIGVGSGNDETTAANHTSAANQASKDKAHGLAVKDTGVQPSWFWYWTTTSKS